MPIVYQDYLNHFFGPNMSVTIAHKTMHAQLSQVSHSSEFNSMLTVMDVNNGHLANN